MIDKLKKLVQFRGKPVIIDLATKEQLPSQLKEYKISCNDEEKESLLHYILEKFKDLKTIVFTNTIKSERKIITVLKLLGHSALRVDGQMAQRDRFKRLEKFLEGGHVLVATDVAGRGLDLPEVGLVIHYNLPKTAETYIHRCGRTARIYNSGTSIVFIGPSDVRSLRSIQSMLGRDIKNFKYDLEEWHRAENYVNIAKKVSHIENDHQMDNKLSSWKLKMAGHSGVDEDSEMKTGPKRQIRILKKQLKAEKGIDRKSVV